MTNLSTILAALGGLGIFLLGMIIMTDSLHKLAGENLRAALMRFTRTPGSGAITGALATALVQSSSATTIATVGFVGSGLMSFSNALGIIFGANIGTTITGWMVALLGFKLSFSSIMLPVIFAGVMMRLFLQRKWSLTGLALAGFGLIFVGIDTMKEAMINLHNIIDFSQLPADTLLAQLQLLALGLVFTIITQSSSAGVAVTLTALYSGIIQFEQAAALVIGMDIGTTVTSVLASIGGTVGAKRTGFSHVIYNFLTALLALAMIHPYIALWGYFGTNNIINNAEIALVGFHTLFNALGVILILPFSVPFARFIKRLFPERHLLREQLEPRLIQAPDLALSATQNIMSQLWGGLLQTTAALLRKPASQTLAQLTKLQQELDETQNYLDQIHIEKEQQREWPRLVNLIHAMDHMQRLHERCEEDDNSARALQDNPSLDRIRHAMLAAVTRMQEQLSQNQWHELEKTSQYLREEVHSNYTHFREEIVEMMGKGDFDADQSANNLRAIRWAGRVSEHLAKINHHLYQALLI